MSDADATQARRDVVADVDVILEHVINANMLNMPYDVYSELFDAVDGLRVEIESLQSENRKLRELLGRGAARPIVVADDGTDGATGSCRCGACGQPIDPWDRWCRHCGTEVAR